MLKGLYLSLTEQVANHLKEEIRRGAIRGGLPGVRRLAADLEVDFKTVGSALDILEREGIVASPEPGKRRRVVPQAVSEQATLRIAILPFDPVGRLEGYVIDLLHRLSRAGHSSFFAGQSLTELGMDVKRVARLVERTPADAWVVVAGSREMLQWFAEQEVPTIALFGRRRGLPLAGVGPDKVPATELATRHLLSLGHRRIVYFARRGRRLPLPGAIERAFLETLKEAGVPAGGYHLPDWDESAKGFHECLRSLFAVTPPTALMLDEAVLFPALQQFLMTAGLQVPDDVSVISTDGHPSFDWCEPSVAHIDWDPEPVVRRVLRWASKIRQGRRDAGQILTRAEFVSGGTVARVAGHAS